MAIVVFAAFVGLVLALSFWLASRAKTQADISPHMVSPLCLSHVAPFFRDGIGDRAADRPPKPS